MAEESEELSKLVRQLNNSIGQTSRGRPPADPSAADLAVTDSHTTDSSGVFPRFSRAAGPPGTDPESATAPVSNRLDELLQEAVRRGASDLLLVAGVPPAIRINGSLIFLDEEMLGPLETKALSFLLLDEVRYRQFQKDKAADFTFERPSVGRFRCDLHHQRGSVAVSIRILPPKIPTIQDLNLPTSYSRFAGLNRGLVLFCGPTGCGKSTSMAALVDIINRTRAVHVVTIEDPIEYLHTHNRSVVEQIEVGRDSASFASALRHALRQNPDVILVGEMRDLETMSIALAAAETGHLVFSTLHTADAAQTVDRIIDVFPEDQQNQIRQQLSLSLAGIAVQVLIPTADGGRRVPSCEILLANDPIRNLIRTGKNHLIHSHITMGRKDGMITMEDSLAAMVKTGMITREAALLRASHREELEKLLN